MYNLDQGVPVERHTELSVRTFCNSVLLSLGATEEEAKITADGLVTASLWWHPGQGQGLEKLFRYKRRILNGGITPATTMVWLKDKQSIALLDAQKGLGYVSANRAMEKAVEKAKGVKKVDLKLVFDPPWTPDMMSEAAKVELNMG